MTAPEQVYDIELVEALDDVLHCYADGARAIAISRHGDCLAFICAAHEDGTLDVLERHLTVSCVLCGVKDIPVEDVTVERIIPRPV